MAGTRADVFEMVGDGDRDALAELLKGDPALASSVNGDGMPLLHAAAQTDDPDLVEVVLARGADRDARASWGHTALQWAANMNARRAASLLLERGSPLDLWTAAALGRTDEVRAIPEGDSWEGPTDGGDAADVGDPTAEPSDRVSDAFYIACRNGALEAAKLLRAYGAEVDALGYFDATALHWAAINGHEAMVEWLVEEGAEASRRDPEFDATPAGWAREGGHEALARRLEEAEGRIAASGPGEASERGDSSRPGQEAS